MDPIPQVIPLQDTTRPQKGKVTKVTIPSYLAKFLMRPKNLHQHEWEVEYFEEEKEKEKKKREAPRERKPIIQAQ